MSILMHASTVPQNVMIIQPPYEQGGHWIRSKDRQFFECQEYKEK